MIQIGCIVCCGSGNEKYIMIGQINTNILLRASKASALILVQLIRSAVDQSAGPTVTRGNHVGVPFTTRFQSTASSHLKCLSHMTSGGEGSYTIVAKSGK